MQSNFLYDFLTLQIGQFFKQCIGHGNDTAMRLESSVCGDHLGKLRRQIYVTHLQLTGVEVRRSSPYLSASAVRSVLTMRLTLSLIHILTGENASDATIEEVFETVCVGK